MNVAAHATELPTETSPTYDLLHQEARSYLPPPAVDLVQRAFEMAAAAHEGQMRNSGEPYLVHLVATAYYLASLRMDVTAVVAGLLHDTIEDTAVTFDVLDREFGESVARIVEGVSKFGEINHRHRWAQDTPEESRRQRGDRARQQAENVRKMFLAMAEDPRVVIVKLADRLHNMRTLQFQKPEKQRRIALDTREIYAPLAGRLGIAQFKTPLEDLSFQYLEPEAYRWLARQIASEREARLEYIDDMARVLRRHLEEHGIQSDITGRAKHLYSIYKKLLRPEIDMDLSRVYDLFALRVVLESEPQCYHVLGLVHALWLPVPERFKDYIARPKTNGYRSLHTTVYTSGSQPTEVQIRTREMHEVAEIGVATHWYYKEQGRSANLPQNLNAWIQSLISWQNELNPDAAEFVDTLKTDMFTGQIFLFSPRGDIIDLPTGATPIDYAYRIHTELGHRTIGAKVNGNMVPLDSELKTGDKVEILTTKHAHGPGREWMRFARTSNARQKIRQWFKRQDREENVARGREILDAELQKLAQKSIGDLPSDALADVAAQLSLRGPDDVYAQLGFGGITPHQVLNRLGVLEVASEGGIPLVAPPPSATTGEVRVLGVGDLLTRLASDCLPAPGDAIIGYITRNRGVTVHRVDCPRIQSEREQERLVHVDWGPRDEQQLYSVSIIIEAWDRDGLARDITNAVAEERINMSSFTAATSSNTHATITATLRIAGIDQLSRVFQRLERVNGVLEVKRQGRSAKSVEQTA